MRHRIFPAVADNRHRGHRLALWLFVPVAFVKLSTSATHLFRADGGAQSISTIPLDRYPASAAQNVVALFARLGVEQLMIALLCILVLVRYRALVPLMYLLFILHFGVSRLVAQAKPLDLAGTSGVKMLPTVLLALSVAGLILSLWWPRAHEAADGPQTATP